MIIIVCDKIIWEPCKSPISVLSCLQTLAALSCGKWLAMLTKLYTRKPKSQTITIQIIVCIGPPESQNIFQDRSVGIRCTNFQNRLWISSMLAIIQKGLLRQPQNAHVQTTWYHNTMRVCDTKFKAKPSRPTRQVWIRWLTFSRDSVFIPTWISSQEFRNPELARQAKGAQEITKALVMLSKCIMRFEIWA